MTDKRGFMELTDVEKVLLLSKRRTTSPECQKRLNKIIEGVNKTNKKLDPIDNIGLIGRSIPSDSDE